MRMLMMAAITAVILAGVTGCYDTDRGEELREKAASAIRIQQDFQANSSKGAVSVRRTGNGGSVLRFDVNNDLVDPQVIIEDFRKIEELAKRGGVHSAAGEVMLWRMGGDNPGYTSIDFRIDQ